MSRPQPVPPRLRRRLPRLRCRHGCSPPRRQKPPPTPCCARPSAVAKAPGTYVRQLALYRAVLKKLYPQLPVRAALLWTETPELMEIYAPALDAQLAALSQGMSKLDPATPRS